VSVRRGLFRVWIVIALLWAVFICSLTWAKIYAPELAPRIYVYEPDTSTFADLLEIDDVPRPRTAISFAQERVTLVLSGNPSHAQAREIVDAFRPRYLDGRHWEAWSVRLRHMGVALLLHAIPSLSLLGLGALFVWAFSRIPPRERNLWADDHQSRPL
jgi:hypothetical protein